MTHAAKKGWSYSTGERGRNRVRAFEHPTTGLLFLEFSDNGARRRVALSHRDREAAKGKAEELARALRESSTPLPANPTLQGLFDNYLRDVTPQKGMGKQAHDRRAARLLIACVGPTRKAAILNRRDWDAFVRWRRDNGDCRSGTLRGRPVRARIIEYDLKFLQSVLNWATMARDGAGRFLLERNPLRGMPWPKEDAPARPVLADEQYAALLEAARPLAGRYWLSLVLAHETGHRISAIRLLRWSDIDLVRCTVRWRAENDKIGFEHVTPLTAAALEALSAARRDRPAVGDAWLFPSRSDPGQPRSRHFFSLCWRRLETLAGQAHVAGLGWHSLRRKFATELKQAPLRDLCYLGGWKDPHTVLQCYQQPDETTMRAALAARARLRGGGLLERREAVPAR